MPHVYIWAFDFITYFCVLYVGIYRVILFTSEHLTHVYTAGGQLVVPKLLQLSATLLLLLVTYVTWTFILTT